MPEKYVIDTSAIFAVIEDEEGADSVEELIEKAKRGEILLFSSFAVFMEAFYITYQEKGEESAENVYLLLRSLPIARVESSERLGLIAGRIKANNKLSFADSWIIATAIDKDAILVHKDPEIENVSENVRFLQLPYKAK